jgi:hypothetical protein
MPVKFNPFTGQLQIDEKGSGGSSYIDGEVATYADLPLDGSAALDSAWLVRTASGVWPVARKQAGIYIRTATGGSNRDADYTYAGTMPDVFSDANFTIYDDADTSKNLKFQLSGITAGTTRTLTIPDANVALPNQGTSTSDKPKFDGLVVGDEVTNDGEGYVTVLGDHKTQIVASTSGQTPLVLVGGSGTFEFWKDTAASRVISVGFATPGNSAGNNLVFSSYAAGVPWAPILEVPAGAAMDVKTGGIQFADSTTNSKKVLLSAANVSAGTTRTLSAPDASGRIQVEGQPIGSTTPAAGTFTTLAANNGTITASAPVLSLSQTWNNAAVAFTGLQFNVTNTASLGTGSNSKLLEINLDGSPIFRLQRSGSTPYLFFGTGDTGIGAISTSQASIIANGGVAFVVNSGSGGPIIRSDAPYAWASGTNLVGASSDLTLFRDAADTLAQRRTTSAQTFNIYNTFTSATNFERLRLAWASNVAIIGTEKGSGGGTARALEFQTDGTTRMTIAANGANCDISSVLRPSSGSTFDLGGNTRRWSRLFVNTTILFGDSTSASDPALKKSGTTLQVRLADDSAYSVLDAQLRAQGTAPATSGATGTAGDIRYDADYIYVCTAASTWKRAAIATW